jgi:hypothetical protein
VQSLIATGREKHQKINHAIVDCNLKRKASKRMTSKE